jgi:hypothetical protein
MVLERLRRNETGETYLTARTDTFCYPLITQKMPSTRHLSKSAQAHKRRK